MMATCSSTNLQSTFDEQGYVVLPDVLSKEQVAAFERQLQAELLGTVAGEAERCVKGKVSLRDPSSFPKKGQRRVIECAPVGVGFAHWEALQTSPRIKAALDVLIGIDAWELPLNKERLATETKASGVPEHTEWIRHFYCPCTFPEVDYAQQQRQKRARLSAAAPAAKHEATSCADSGSSADQIPSVVGRDVQLCSWKDEMRSYHFTNEEIDAPRMWQPVSRRRFRGKGWHVDIGPGFPTDAKRLAAGHPLQGMIVLVLLSDWKPGAGGTAMVPGSHFWVARKLQQAGSTGIVHRELNMWCANTMLDHIRNRRLRIFADGEKRSVGAHDDIVELRQIVGTAGSVVLVHPWLIHCGTTNHSSRPRLLANGMVRIKDEVFARDGCRHLQRTMEVLRERACVGR